MYEFLIGLCAGFTIGLFVGLAKGWYDLAKIISQRKRKMKADD